MLNKNLTFKTKINFIMMCLFKTKITSMYMWVLGSNGNKYISRLTFTITHATLLIPGLTSKTITHY